MSRREDDRDMEPYVFICCSGVKYGCRDKILGF